MSVNDSKAKPPVQAQDSDTKLILAVLNSWLVAGPCQSAEDYVLHSGPSYGVYYIL